jgi:hypothetical protein
MTETMHANWGAEQPASENQLLAAERTFSAWIRAGLTAGGGLAAGDDCSPVGHRRAGVVDHPSMNDDRAQLPAPSALRLYGTDQARTRYRQESSS